MLRYIYTTGFSGVNMWTKQLYLSCVQTKLPKSLSAEFAASSQRCPSGFPNPEVRHKRSFFQMNNLTCSQMAELLDFGEMNFKKRVNPSKVIIHSPQQQTNKNIPFNKPKNDHHWWLFKAFPSLYRSDWMNTAIPIGSISPLSDPCR